jgi:hypothetical protein
MFQEGGISGSDAFWNVIGSQSRIGIIFSVYFSKNEKKENNKTE